MALFFHAVARFTDTVAFSLPNKLLAKFGSTKCFFHARGSAGKSATWPTVEISSSANFRIIISERWGKMPFVRGVSRVIWSPRPFSFIRLRGRVVVSMESRGRVVA